MTAPDQYNNGAARRQASALVAAGQHQRAADTARASLATNPDDPGLLVVLATACSQLRDAKAACDAAQRAVAIAPDWAPAHGALGDAHLLASNNWSAAIDAYSAAARLNPAEYTYFTGRAQATLRLVPTGRLLTPSQRRGRAELLASARRDADYALRLEPNEALAHVAKAKVLLSAGETLSAKASADRALSIDPTHPVALQVRGIALNLIGDVRSASEALVSAAKHDPRSDAPIRLLRGMKVAAPVSFIALWIVFRILIASGESGGVGLVLAAVGAAAVAVWVFKRYRKRSRLLSPEARQALKVDRRLRRATWRAAWLPRRGRR